MEKAKPGRTSETSQRQRTTVNVKKEKGGKVEMGTFFQSARKPQGNIKDFLAAAAGGNSLKYTPVAGKTHHLYIPYKMEQVLEEGVNNGERKALIAESASVHGWETDGNRFTSCVCLEGVYRQDKDGNVLNEGKCPMCERARDSWAIYRMRKEKMEAACTMPAGKDRDESLKKQRQILLDERKVSDADAQLYVLVVQLRLGDGDQVVIDETTKLPAFDLKIMKMSASRAGKINDSLEMMGMEFAGSEIKFKYPTSEDRRAVVSQSTFSAMPPTGQVVPKYPGLYEAIETEVKKFQFDGIEKAFPEWAGMTDEQARKAIDPMFEMYDRYVEQKKINPQAVYLEYEVAGSTAATNVSLGATVPTAIPMPLPDVNGVAAGAPASPAAPAAPEPSATDINNVFAQAVAQPAPAPVAPPAPAAPAAPVAPPPPPMPLAQG